MALEPAGPQSPDAIGAHHVAGSAASVLVAAAYSSKGKVRTNQEDSYGLLDLKSEDVRHLDNKGFLAVVCDGMGGREAGQWASRIATDAIIGHYYNDIPAGDVGRNLVQAIQIANAEVYSKSSQQGAEWFGMGTTVAAVVIKGGSLWVANIGDSRVYLARNNHIIQLSTDHTLGREQLTKKLMTMEQVAVHPNRGALTRTVGLNPTADVELRPIVETVVDGDTLILCSDGATDLVSDLEIAGLVRKNGGRPKDVARALVELADKRGGHDNATVVAVTVGQPARSIAVPMPLVVAALAVVVTLAGIGVYQALRAQQRSNTPDAAVETTPGAEGVSAATDVGENTTATPTSRTVSTLVPTKAPISATTPATSTPVPARATSTPVPVVAATNTPVSTSTPSNTPVPAQPPTNTPGSAPPTNTPVPAQPPTNTPGSAPPTNTRCATYPKC